MNDRFYTNELSEIRSFCIRSDKEDIYKYIYSLQQENQELKDRIDKTVDVINTQMKNADEGTKENLRIIKFNLIKGSCTFEDLKTEEDYKY